MDAIDTAWCPVCERQILPKYVPLVASASSSPSGSSNCAQPLARKTTITRPNNSRPSIQRSKTAAATARKNAAAAGSDKSTLPARRVESSNMILQCAAQLEPHRVNVSKRTVPDDCEMTQGALVASHGRRSTGTTP